MADKTRIDPDLARAEIARLKGIASRFQSAVDKIKSDAAQHAGCWGNDEFGQAFGKSYEPGEKQMLDNSGQMKEGVTNTATQVEQAVDAFEKTDEVNARNLSAAESRPTEVSSADAVDVSQVREVRLNSR
jgi:uncharacterized protein YukE